MFDLLLQLVITILTNFASLASLVTALLVIASLAIAGTLPNAENLHVEVLEFDPETLRNRRRRLRPSPIHPQDITLPQTPQEEAQVLPQVQVQEPIVRPALNPLDNYIIPPRQVDAPEL